MPSGNLDRYITIQQPSYSDSAYGDNEVVSYSTYTQCWAEKTDLAGTEDDDMAQISAQQFVKWKIRYDSGVHERMRILYDSKYYDITSIQEIGRRHFLEILSSRSDATYNS